MATTGSLPSSTSSSRPTGRRPTAPPCRACTTSRSELVTAPDPDELPDFYELHLWLWKSNPSGLFEDWNPRVSCRGLLQLRQPGTAAKSRRRVKPSQRHPLAAGGAAPGGRRVYSRLSHGTDPADRPPFAQSNGVRAPMLLHSSTGCAIGEVPRAGHLDRVGWHDMRRRVVHGNRPGLRRLRAFDDFVRPLRVAGCPSASRRPDDPKAADHGLDPSSARRWTVQVVIAIPGS